MERAILAAIEAQFGVRISAGQDPASTKALFYKTRKEMLAQGVTMAAFVSCQTPPNLPSELWLVKKLEKDSTDAKD